MDGSGDDEEDGVPEWYALIRAARYLGVAPWELLQKPLYWQAWAYEAENAEIEAENQRQKRAAAKHK